MKKPKPILLEPFNNYTHHSPTSITAEEMFHCRTGRSGCSSDKRKTTTTQKGSSEFPSQFCGAVWQNRSVAGAQPNTPKGEEKHPWRQLRFRVVAPLFITCPVCSVTAEGDGGKGREGERGRERETEREPNTDRGWPVNSRAEENTIVFSFLFFFLDWGPLSSVYWVKRQES